MEQQEIYTFDRDTPFITTGKESPTKPTKRHKSYSMIIRGLCQVAAGAYRLAFDEDPPKPGDAIKG